MNHHYSDITDLISESPRWFDEHAVPRFCEFQPNQCANVYADEVALVRIACQDCEHEFLVVLSWSKADQFLHNTEPLSKYAPNLDYGDPPNIACCAAGPTMSSITLETVEFWKRTESRLEWERLPGLEGIAEGER